MEATGCSSSHANSKLHLWKGKHIDCDELFNPIKKEKYKSRDKIGTSNWRGLSNKSRKYNLSKMKSPSKWELEQPEPGGFFSGEGGHMVGRAGSKTYLRGD